MDDYPYTAYNKPFYWSDGTLEEIHNGWTKLHALCEAQNWRCAYCSKEIEYIHGSYIQGSVPHYRATFDHVIPKSHGGNRNWSNLVASCFRCNCERGAIPAVTWYVKVSAK